MAALNVNPNRMELLKLKKKLATAVRGHKLLKDKLEGLLKDFMAIIHEYVGVRLKVDARMGEIFKQFILANGTMETEFYAEALAFPNLKINLSVEEKIIMSVRIPKFDFSYDGELISYGFYNTSPELDSAMGDLSELTVDLVKVAELEKTVKLMADEIEKTRRRVNALEYIMIPRIEETIKMIESKLDELERGNITRLMKIKEILAKEE